MKMGIKIFNGKIKRITVLTIIILVSLSTIFLMQSHATPSKTEEQFNPYEPLKKEIKNREIKAKYEVKLVTGDIVTAGIIKEDNSKDNRTTRVVILGVRPYDPKKLDRSFKIIEDEYGVYVIPDDVNLQKADINLFNIKYLIEEQYYNMSKTPIIVSLNPAKKIEAQSFIDSVFGKEESGKVVKSYKMIPASSVNLIQGKMFYDLQSSEYVTKIWLDRKVRASLYQSVPLIGAPNVWNLGYNGSGMKIAILDTGIDPYHESFYFENGTSKIITQVDFTDDNDPYDYVGHGTHVASIAAGVNLTTIICNYNREFASNEWIDGGTPMNWHGDDGSWEYTMPFPFPFCGVEYTIIYVSSNGLITFVPDSSFSNSIDRLAEKVAIAPAWDDWRTDRRPGDDIYIWQPDPNHLIIRWKVVAFYNNAIEANFEAILGSDGTIRFNYGLNNGTVSATIGISDSNSGMLIAEDLSNLNYIDSRIFTPADAEEVQISGVAPGALLMNVKVLNRYGWGYESWVISGIEYAAYYGPNGVPNDGDEANITNLSLAGGLTDGTDPLSLACDAAMDAGKLVVVAAGNNGYYGSINAPGAARKAITVGASSKFDTIAQFSSRGPTIDFRVKPDLLAPGVGILAARAGSGDGYIGFSGTSMATPHVSGVIALIKQARPSLNSTMIKNLLTSTSISLGYDVYTQGGGRLNALAAVETSLFASPATISLGRIPQGMHSFDVAFINTESNTIDVSLTPSLRRLWLWYGDDWSGRVSLNVTSLSIPAGKSRWVRVTVDTTGLPIGVYSGVLNTNYTVDDSTVHAIFGFSHFNFLSITFYGLDGNTPISNRLVGVFNNDTGEWTYTYTDSEGRATFYVPDGTYYIVGWDWGRNMYADAYAIRVEQVTGDMDIALSLQGAHKISYSPSAPNQVIAGLTDEIWHPAFSPWPFSLANMWYYPSRTDIYVSSTDLYFSSYYQHYDRNHMNIANPSVLLTPELYSILFVNKSITAGKTLSFSNSQLARVEKDYRTAFTPGVAAYISRSPLIVYWVVDSYGGYGFTIPSLTWVINSPRKLVEWCGGELQLNGFCFFSTRYEKEGDQPNVETPYFNYWGSEDLMDPGTYRIATNSHPLSPYFYLDVESYDSGNKARLWLYSNVFSEDYSGYGGAYLCSDNGRIIIRKDGTEIYDSYWFYDSQYVGFEDIDLPAEFEIEVHGISNLPLSAYAFARLKFEVPTGGWTWLFSPIALNVMGLDLNNTHVGGDVTGYVYSWLSQLIKEVSVEYSLDDGAMWSPAEVSQVSTNNYSFTIRSVSDSFVSLRVNSTIEDQYGISYDMSYTVLRGFWVMEAQPTPRVSSRTFVEVVPDLAAIGDNVRVTVRLSDVYGVPIAGETIGLLTQMFFLNG
ncbi:MAG: S8 family serine peptidase, partial [Candidatus Brockarchaeota archaeon]|nr:S8 family serine peptidase [Candidatus Brockarchaeota archaeon]